jgi:hypothetical protein
MRRSSVFVVGLLAVVLIIGSSTVWARPSCAQLADVGMCNSYCWMIGQGMCYSYYFDGPPPINECAVVYLCTNTPWIERPQECSCGTGCFLAGTQITMADSTTKAIEEIEVGDVVLAYDEATGELKPDTVSKVHDPVVWDHYFLVNGSMKLTPSHPVLSDGTWVEIGKLEVGDTLTAADGKAVPIESIETIKESVTVYNFATNPYQTYIANGIIVHNKPPIPTEP